MLVNQMQDIRSFAFARARGVVWVCDVEGSSKFLNDNKSAGDLEAFLPRLYWTSSMLVEEAGGTFIKWTGDGFLAWFEIPLHREIGAGTAAAISAIEHLTLLVNVTQLGTSPKKKFKLRHGLAFEHDALLTNISHLDGHQGLDVMGRAVVLAFRLSGVPATPGIAVHGDVVKGYRDHGRGRIYFKKWTPTAEDHLKFFKGERWGTGSLYVSTEAPRRRRSLRFAVRKAKRALASAEGKTDVNPEEVAFIQRFLERFANGPRWCKSVLDEYTRFVREELLGSVLRFVELAERLDQRTKSRGDRET